MPVFNYKQRHNIVLIILIILGCAILYSMRTIAGALLSTIIFYAIFRPVFFFLTERWHFKKIPAAVTIIILSLIILVLPFLTLWLLVIDKIAEFQADPIRVQYIIGRIDSLIGSYISQPHFIENALKNIDDYISDLFPSILSAAADILLGLAVMYFILYFMFVQREEFENALLRYAPFREQNSLRFASELRNITFSNVLGQGFIAVVQGSLLTSAFFIFGINDAIFWGVITVLQN